MSNPTTTLEDPAYYRWHVAEGVLEIRMPTPHCISATSRDQINALLDMIRLQMEDGVIEHDRRMADLKKLAAPSEAVFEEAK